MYDEDKYAKPHAIRHKEEFNNGRIDFSPYPYPSATELIVDSMNKTVVGGEKTFLNGLDPKFVASDLVDYKHVKAAMEKHKVSSWRATTSVISSGAPGASTR